MVPSGKVEKGIETFGLYFLMITVIPDQICEYFSSLAIINDLQKLWILSEWVQLNSYGRERIDGALEAGCLFMETRVFPIHALIML